MWYVLWYIVHSIVYMCDLILSRIWFLGLCPFIIWVLQSAPESPVIGWIETPAASLPSADTAEKPSEPTLKAPEHTPAAAEGTSNAGGSGSNGAEGSKGPSVWLVPFQSMPQSTQEELGKELFDDPLLSLDNMKKLTDYMQWSFKFTKVGLLPLLVFVE